MLKWLLLGILAYLLVKRRQAPKQVWQAMRQLPTDYRQGKAMAADPASYAKDITPSVRNAQDMNRPHDVIDGRD